ncbi:hypothetical protein [Phyllobacterium leguminum]|uniref:DUF3168 domain-containing protein n=1 Tax=Phyllobacterium leguminum TaxID=314237 RepID=A0A318T5J6_9HYPH|nr:hypothetical protein [Phyllobacterium leguminum]PYE89585.1 hypothetical protein C7477_10393 [Phyllobacterium leguminum]
MNAPVLNVLPGLYAAVVAVPAITSKLGSFNGAPSVHTRRPVPSGATYPMITIGPVITRSDEDGITDHKPVVVLDINIYGPQPDSYRNVEAVADLIYSLFHRQARSFTVANYQVWMVTCSGPSPAPVDDESRVGRRVTLTIRLRAQ